MWFENEIEAPAVRAYHLDTWTEEDFSIMDMPSDSAVDDNMSGIQMKRIRHNDSVDYEGGLEDK